MPIACDHENLSDLAATTPMLVDSGVGLDSGVRILRRLGVGGMSAVFRGERVYQQTGRLIDDDTPVAVAVKLLQPATAVALDRYGIKPMEFVKKEVVALQRLSALRPRPPNVIDYYGCGEIDVSVKGRPFRVPWMAVELIDGGPAGLNLLDRVLFAEGGVDPIRAHRLVSGIAAGLEAVHSVGVIHRDLKPENILLAGPVDDEQPKLSDCGIARVSGLETSMLAAVTPAYGGVEQFLPATPGGNPLVGTWTDVHAFAAVAWFLIAGEQWHRDVPQYSVHPDWLAGERRSLRTSTRLHPAFARSSALAALDAALVRGSSPTLPDVALESERARSMHSLLVKKFPPRRAFPARYTDVASFMRDLEPALAEIAQSWRRQAAVEHRPATQFRPTIALSPLTLDEKQGAYVARVTPAEKRPPGDAPLDPDSVAYYPDGSAVARSKGALVYIKERRAHAIRSPEERRLPGILQTAIRILHADLLGCAIVAPTAVALVRSNVVSILDAPRVAGKEVGEIVSCHRYGGRLAIVTDETDDTEGTSELWWTTDGKTWSEPIGVSLNGGRARASAEGPYGALIVGTREQRGKASACAAFVSNDGSTTAYAKGLGAIPGLSSALVSAEQDAWASNGSSVLRLSRGAATPETVEGSTSTESQWSELALDLVGIPWLATPRALYRREIKDGAAIWSNVFTREYGEPDLVSLSFTPQGAFVLDREFATVHVTPHDVERWAGAIV